MTNRLEPIIYVSLSAAEEALIEAAARRGGATVAQIDLGDASDRDEMIAIVSEALGLSTRHHDLNAAIDDFTDYMFLTNPHGYLWLVDGLERALDHGPLAFEKFLVMLPSVSHRWRHAEVPFAAVLKMASASASERALQVLDAENRWLDEAGRRYPRKGVDSHSVTVLTRYSGSTPWDS